MDGWIFFILLGFLMVGDIFDWGFVIFFIEFWEYVINVQFDLGVFVYFMFYIKR